MAQLLFMNVFFALKGSKLFTTTTEKKQCCHFFFAVFYSILFILACNDDMHESSEELEIRPDPIRDHRVSCS